MGVGLIGRGSAKMRPVAFACQFLILCSLLIIAKSEIYIVTMEGEPVISYKGDIDGFEATAVESDEKIDVTRCFQIFLTPFFVDINLGVKFDESSGKFL